jgi:hypothetical protein
MKGWKQSEGIDFNFHDAHDLKPLTALAANELYIKVRLRERFANAAQVIVLIGENTKNLYKFVRWEMEIAQKLDLPIIAVNLNQKRTYDSELCPAILRNHYVVHVCYKAKILQYALDNFPEEYRSRDPEVPAPLKRFQLAVCGELAGSRLLESRTFTYTITHQTAPWSKS